MATFDDLHRRRYEPRPVPWRGRYPRNWFSNFEPGSAGAVALGGLRFATVEAAYQAAKRKNPAERVALAAMSASEAKRAGRKGVLRPDWDRVAIACMDFLIRQKFADGTPELARLASESVPPVEYTTWGDRRWGVGEDWEGRNALGLLLSLVRDDLRRLGRVPPGAEEDRWEERQRELVARMNRVGPRESVLQLGGNGGLAGKGGGGPPGGTGPRGGP